MNDTISNWCVVQLFLDVRLLVFINLATIPMIYGIYSLASGQIWIKVQNPQW